MLRFVIAIGARESLKAADIEHALASYRDGAYEIIEVNHTTGYGPREMAVARARHAAFHWKGRASLYIGLASGKNDRRPIIYINAVNADGEEGEVLQWAGDSSPNKEDGQVIAALATTAIKGIALWLKLFVPPVSPIIIEQLRFK